MSNAHVEIIRRGLYCQLDAAHHELVSQLFAGTIHRAQADEDGHITIGVSRVQTSAQVEDGRIAIPMGSVPRVRQALEASGFTVSVIGRSELPRRCRERRGDIESCQPEKHAGLEEALDQNITGLIEAQRDRPRHEFIADIVRFYPDARTLVVCRSVHRTQSVVESLSSLAPGNANAANGRNWNVTNRVMVVTRESFRFVGYPHDWDIVIFENAPDVATERLFEVRCEFTRQRVYGFVSPGELDQDLALMLQLEVNVGGVIFARSPAPTRRLAIALADYECPATRIPIQDRRKRCQAIWSLPHRNLAVAQLAALLASGDVDRLAEFGLAQIEGWLNAAERTRVAVLVDNPAQAARIASSLGDWPIVGSGDVSMDGSFATGGWSPGFIVTSVASHLLKRLGATILINACGSERGWVPQSFLNTDQDLLVIDLNDHCHESLERASQRRLASYLAAGFAELPPAARAAAPIATT